jgi:hypothetical protein
MFSFRDFIIFLAGVEFFHTISHILLVLSSSLPSNLKAMMLAPSVNIWAIFINGIITVALFVLAISLSKNQRHNR